MYKLLISLLLLVFTSLCYGVDKSVLTKEYQHTPFELYLSPQEAFDLKMESPDSVLFIDIRTKAEIRYLGIADAIDANIPYRLETGEWKMKKDGVHGTFRRDKNPDFVIAVETLVHHKQQSKDSPIILMCASGTRSPYAARALHEVGFKEVYTQVEGFEGVRKKSGPDKGRRVVNGWKNAGLPWSYNLLPEKMYFNFDPKQSLKN